MKINIKKIILFVLFPILISQQSCDLLKTRDAETPNKNNTNWDIPTTPQILISNFKSAVVNRSTENYLMCFIDTNLIRKSYKFIPTYESYLKYSSVFSNWNLFNEKIYFDNLKSKFSESSTFTFNLTNENFNTIQSDSVSYSASYTISISHNLPQYPKEYRGNLEFTLYRNVGGVWALGTWTDYLSDPNVATWSQLKGSFSY